MVALVTGASAGIGRDIARSLAMHGIDLIITARRKERLDELKNELKEKYGVRVKAITADLTSVSQCKELHRRVQKYGIDIFINNAGMGVFGDFTKTDLDRELDMIHLNIRAFHVLFKLFLQDFEKRGGGYIMNTASSAAFFAGPMFASYYATKAYVLRMSQAVNEELRHKRSGVYVSVLCPGPVATEFMERSGARFSVPPKSSEYVAEYAVREMFGGRFLLLPSFTDKASAVLGKLVPDSISAYAVRLIQSHREEL